VHQLQEYFSAGLMDGVRDRFSALDLGLVEEPWHPGIAQAVGRGAFGDDQILVSYSAPE
jgi:hypothetical protein